MALAAVQTAMKAEKNSVHPFFSKSSRNCIPGGQPPAIEVPAGNAHDDSDYEQQEKAHKGQKKRGRKPGSTNKVKTSPVGKNQSILELFTKSSGMHPAAEGAPTNAAHNPGKPTMEEDPNQERRKRRKTNSPPPARTDAAAVEASADGPPDWHQQLTMVAGEDMSPGMEESCAINTEPLPIDGTMHLPSNSAKDALRAVTPPNDDMAESGAIAHQSPVPTSAISNGTPKKTIKVTKSGKLLSSPPKAPAEPMAPKKRRGRKPKPKAAPTITIIKYGHDSASRAVIGEKIEAILKSVESAPRPVTPKKAPLKTAGPPKPTHPFFLGKAAQKSDEAVVNKQTPNDQALLSPRKEKRSAVTPGKLKTETRSFHQRTDMPTFGSAGNKRVSKQPGQAEAPWPSKDTAHVRNLDVKVSPDTSPISLPSLRARKMKKTIFSVPQEEDLMANLAFELQSYTPDRDGLGRSDFGPPKDVRLPSRLLTTGVDLQGAVSGQVASLSASWEQTHPAIKTLFADIEHTLTPFDLGKCEPLSWVQKYAPKHASHVLQFGKEPMILKDWLQNLTVLAVDGKHDGAVESKKPPKKKRKKAVDDFIVDSEEEEEEDMVEVSGGDGEYESSSSSLPKSLRRERWTRNKNVVLISGPHGCGKSAMVHAVAKDLGFEIFEINSGSRRSGKDIQDKVGNMSENHLVSHKREGTSTNLEVAPADDMDTERHSEALQKDLESGRQGTMMSFFASTGPAKENAKARVKAPEPKKVSKSGQATLPITQPQRKSQKQSLILFEEADVLFEEDQGFWAQVTRLASQSKRPIVITCTDEALIPSQELPLAAILRISPPPIELATDYMVVLAGHEGHILERDAVSSLYRSKKCDLRASITELNLWCQMSVGDPKGGLEWIYQRWPPGKDVDEQGRVLRVASQGTYASGMGCLSYNTFKSADNIGYDRAEELLKESWEEWQISPSNWTGSMDEPAHDTLGSCTLKDLERLDARAESISAADTYCRIDMPSYQQHFEQPTDPSLPPLQEKARLSYTLAAPVIQVDHISDFSHFDTDMFIQSHLLLLRAYGERPSSDVEQNLPIPTTERGFAGVISQHEEQTHCANQVSRPNFSQAFDILAYPPDTLPVLNTSYSLTASSFDRPFQILVEDLAPYVRSIVAHELVLENQRIRLGNLLCEGGSRSNKRQRTTRAARTALEGGSRDTKRRERWFDKDLNRSLVMGTAGKGWTGLGSGSEEAETDPSAAGTQEE